MKEVNWDNFKARCSGLHKVMSDPSDNRTITLLQMAKIDELKAKKNVKITEKQSEELAYLIKKRDQPPALSDTCTTYLLEVYAWEKYGKRPTSSDKIVRYMQKGKLVEEESITLLSLHDRIPYEKNTERVSNDFIIGEHDILTPDHQKVIDIKSKWDYIMFLAVIGKPLPAVYKWQTKGYMDILRCPYGEVANCLVNTPESIVNDELKRLFYRMNVATEEAPEYKEAANQLINNMTFDNIPMEQRIYKVPVERTDEEMIPVYERVKLCRTWLWEFDEMYMKINKK